MICFSSGLNTNMSLYKNTAALRVYTKAFGRRVASLLPRFPAGVHPLRNPQDTWCQNESTQFLRDFKT